MDSKGVYIWLQLKDVFRPIYDLFTLKNNIAYKIFS